MYVRSAYRAKKFATGGAVITDDGGSTLVMKPPPGPMAVPEDISEDIAPVDQVAAAIERARSFRELVPDLPKPIEDRSLVSAPVSRETMGWSTGRTESRPGRLTLSMAQREAAKIAGVSEAEYATQLLRLREAKDNGDYLESR